MLLEQFTEYKTYKSEEMVSRPDIEKTLIQAIQDKPKGVFVLEGDRGAGKTSMLLTIYHYFLKEKNCLPFFIGLFPYQAPEFAQQESLWLEDKKFTATELPELLQKITRGLKVAYVEVLDPDNQREYIAKQLASRSRDEKIVLLIDSIYECDEETRSQIEQNLILPLLASSQVSILLSGRGKRPNWSSPELRSAEIIPLELPSQQFVREQLEKMKSRHVNDYERIARWSGGCPLVVRILGKAESISLDVLDKAIDILIRESLPEEGVSDYKELRSAIEKLSLLMETFREGDIVNYLYPDELEKRTKTTCIIRLLLESYLLEWEAEHGRRGYRLNQTVAKPVRAWLLEQPSLEQYQKDWQSSVTILVDIYPSLDKNDYMKMLMHSV